MIQEKQKRNIDLLITAACVVILVISGATVQMVLRAQGLLEVPIEPNGKPIVTKHSYMQTLFMFIGEFLSIFIWIPEYFIKKQKGIVTQLKEGRKWFKFFPHVFLFAIPTLCDLIASTLLNVGVFFMLVSIQQMLRNLYVLFLATFSACCFRDYRRNFDLPQGIGLLILVIGSMLISYSAIAFNDNKEEARNNTIGVIVTLIGSCFAAMFNVSEEIFLRRIQLSPNLLVSIEGAWGLLLNIILMPIYEHVDDPFSDQVPKPKMENCYVWYKQTQHSALYTGLMIAQPLLACIYNASGCNITARVSAVARGTFVAIRVILVWIASFCIKWEVWHPKATPIRIVGFVFVVVGSFTYNNVTQWLPFLKPQNKAKYGMVGDQCKMCCCPGKIKKSAAEQGESTESQSSPEPAKPTGLKETVLEQE